MKGHVVSTDPSFISDTHLKLMWLKGGKHKVQMHPGASLEALQKDLQEFITSTSKRLPAWPTHCGRGSHRSAVALDESSKVRAA